MNNVDDLLLLPSSNRNRRHLLRVEANFLFFNDSSLIPRSISVPDKHRSQSAVGLQVPLSCACRCDRKQHNLKQDERHLADDLAVSI